MVADRREFLKRAALAAAATAATPLASEALEAEPKGAAGSQPGRTLDRRVLEALGDAVLPERLGASGRRSATTAFADWLSGYRPVAEEMHGYGYAEITYTPPDPAPGWNAQLQGLDLLASQLHGSPFDRLEVARRRSVVAAALDRVTGNRLPSNPISAPHVVLALLAHWAASAEAVDQAYGARVGRGTCRPLEEAARRPLPLAPER